MTFFYVINKIPNPWQTCTRNMLYLKLKSNWRVTSYKLIVTSKPQYIHSLHWFSTWKHQTKPTLQSIHPKPKHGTFAQKHRKVQQTSWYLSVTGQSYQSQMHLAFKRTNHTLEIIPSAYQQWSITSLFPITQPYPKIQFNITNDFPYCTSNTS